MDNLQASRINGGNSLSGRRASDFYPTPPEVTFALLKFLRLPTQTHIWEPACGDGHIVNVMEAMDYQVTGTDIQSGDDFLIIQPMDCDWTITNPPFRLVEQFIKRCAEHNKPFALLSKTQFWNAAKRHRLFQEVTPTWILPLTWRPDFTGGGQAMMDMAWNVWRPGHKKTYFYPLAKPSKEEMEMLEKANYERDTRRSDYKS